MTQHHIPKAVTFGGIIVLTLFIVGASYWYKQVRMEERTPVVETPTKTKFTPHSLSKEKF